MKKLLLLVCLMSIYFIQAQTAKDITSWEVTLSNPDFKVGEEVEIIITVNIEPKWHLYSTDFDPDCGPLPTEISFKDNGTYQIVGAILPEGATEKFDEVFECNITDFATIGVFKQKIIPQQKNILVEYSTFYQVCQDEGVCLAGDETFVKSFISH